MKKTAFLIITIAMSMFASCETPGGDNPAGGKPGDEFTIPDDGEVPSTVIPDEIRDLLEREMPIYSGKTPPDIKGEYLADSKILTDSNYSDDVIGKGYVDQYISFTKGANGKIRFDAEERRFGLPVSDDTSDDVTVYLVGTGNKFTAWFISTGQTYEIYNKESMIVSGTLTKNGIEDYHSAFVMLEKGADPTPLLVPVNTYRVFKEEDGMAERTEWLSDRENRALLINGEEEAWTSTDRGEAYIFTDTGTFSKYTLSSGVWNYSTLGSYSIGGRSLTLNAVDHPFSITANTLKITIGGTETTFTRTKPFTAGEIDEELVLPEGEAWVQAEQYITTGYMFSADGTYGYYVLGATWNRTSGGTWNTGGGRLVINQTGIDTPQSYTYTVSGGTLTLRGAFGDEDAYTRQAIPTGN